MLMPTQKLAWRRAEKQIKKMDDSVLFCTSVCHLAANLIFLGKFYQHGKLSLDETEVAIDQ